MPLNDSAISAGQTYVACDWSTDVKDKCYDIDAAVSNDDVVLIAYDVMMMSS